MTVRASFAFTALIAAFWVSPAAAHPHVFVDSTSDYIVDDNRNMTAVRHHWTFDPAFSAYAIQGLDTDGDGTYSREELTDLAKENVESLADFEFFTFMESNGSPVAFEAPVDYWLDYDGTQLTLNFTLPLTEKLPLKGSAASVQVYDPTIFVAFFLDQKTPATVTGAACTVEHIKVGENKLTASSNFSDDFLAAIDEMDNFASQFAEEIKVSCT